MIKSGKFAMYNGHEYELSEDMDDNTVIITKDTSIIDDSFCDLFKSGTYSKIVDIKELDEVYDVISYGIIEGHKVHLRKENNEAYYIGTDDYQLAGTLSLERTDKFAYEGWVTKDRVQIVEERID